jgi:hypothetical protein
LVVARSGDTLDSLAAEVGKSNPALARMSLQEKKAILIANNRIQETRPLQPGQILNLSETPAPAEALRAWQCDSPSMCRDFASLSPELQGLLQHAGDSTPSMSGFAETFRDEGWLLGDTIVKDIGLAVQIGDAGVGGASELLTAVRRQGEALSKELFATLGKDVVTSKSPRDLARVEQHLKGSRTYQGLRTSIDRLPEFLKRRLGQIAPGGADVPSAAARWVRRDVVIPYSNGSPARAWGRMVGNLEGTVTTLGRVGKATTWVVPALIGVYSTVRAPDGKRLRVGIEEAVGVGFGGVGGMVGAFLGGLLITFLCLSGVGAFVVVALAAGVGSYVAGESGKMLVRPALDFLSVG